MRSLIRKTAFALALLLALPAQAAWERTWQQVLNQVNAGADAEGKTDYLVWFTKSILQGNGTGLTYKDQAGNTVTPSANQWTVYGSSDGLGNVSVVGADLWTTTFDATKIVHAAGAVNHSWIALQSGHNTNYKFLIDCNSATVSVCAIKFGYGAFVGGTATAAPTIPTTTFGGTTGTGAISTLVWDDGTNTSKKVHGMLSSTGDFWIYGSKDGTGYFWFTLAGVEILNSPTGFTPNYGTYPLWTYENYSATRGALTVSTNTPFLNPGPSMMTRFNRAAAAVWPVVPTVNVSLFYNSTSGTPALTNLGDPDPASGTFMWPLHLFVWDATAVDFAYAGRVPDLWLTSLHQLDGTDVPASGNADYTVAGNCLVPWGGTTPPAL